MSPEENGLIAAATDGNFSAVEAALAAGESVNGRPEQPYPPIVAAIVANQAGMVNFLIGKGADPDRAVAGEVLFPSSGMVSKTIPGERALHIAAWSGKVEIVRLLLKRSRADPNATSNRGHTPLSATCLCRHVCVEVVRLLLEAGADPALAAENGFIPLHGVALNGHMDLVDMLYAGAPATLNHCAANGETPLFYACNYGQENMVSRLLSLGANQRISPENFSMCPLTRAVSKGFVGVVRVLINEGGIRAVGGDMALAQALRMAPRFRQARILRLLLAADGEERRSEWANESLDGSRLLHFGASYCCPAAVSVLLEAGADEAARDWEGHTPRDVIGLHLGRDDEPQMDPEKEVAVRRMLQRGQAYRARSWAWPSDEEADAGGSGDGGTAAAAAAAAAVLSSSPAMKTPPVPGVRIFRPEEETRNKLFVRLIGRYCAKD